MYHIILVLTLRIACTATVEYDTRSLGATGQFSEIKILCHYLKLFEYRNNNIMLIYTRIYTYYIEEKNARVRLSYKVGFYFHLPTGNTTADRLPRI